LAGRRWRDPGSVGGGSGEPGRDGGLGCWGETYLIRIIEILIRISTHIFETILYINLNINFILMKNVTAANNLFACVTKPQKPHLLQGEAVGGHGNGEVKDQIGDQRGG
jgi:hypothetical protein